MLWTTLSGDKLQGLAEKLVAAVVHAAPNDSRCDPERLRNLLPAQSPP
jgi:hypothetical protein